MKKQSFCICHFNSFLWIILPFYKVKKNILGKVMFVSVLMSLLSCTKDNIVEPKEPDYFPITVNSQIKFRYYSGVSNAVYAWEDVGEVCWNISSSKQNGSIKVYEVSEKRVITHKIYAPVHSEKADSSFTTFYINESNSNMISFNLSILDGVSFNRYLDKKQEQGGLIQLDFANPGSSISTVKVSLKQNVGITKIVRFGNKWSESYELIQ